jgi:20S proteasome alpha/beta subunit
MSIGARSQSAKTYLERHLDEFVESDLDALVAHGLRALRDTLPNEIELNNKVWSRFFVFKMYKAFSSIECQVRIK